MEFKDYQQQVLTAVDAYLEELVRQRSRSEKLREASARDPELGIPIPDFAEEAWAALSTRGALPPARAGIPYSSRVDGTNTVVPNICLKVPTGGGKTLLAVATSARVLGEYLSRNTGFVLWIVPNEAIYTQTRKQLVDRDHPYRQMLDKAGAGRVRILEKESPLNRADVESNLCVMLLMLQSANRQTKEALRLFRDRGNVHGFFPSEGDGEAHSQLRAQIPNLDCYGEGFLTLVKDSLGNVLRLIRPVVVIDEGHKAYSAGALNTIYGFNPAFVLELSATPKDRPRDTPPRFANWLVDVRGKQLADEQMVKLPINVKVKGGDDWRDCLRESLDLLDDLQRASDKLQAESNRYIRPILLVQVERTGKEQRETGFIHAADAREFLLQAGLSDPQIAIKTSEQNDLANPENVDLLSPASSVRVIITKQALQEGWDCPFAYVLCALAASTNMSAMTQLVGRILRQPDARLTSVARLDECYVVCHHATTKNVIDGIKKGLEQEGMSDLSQQVREVDDLGIKGKGRRRLPRRAAYAKTPIYLPVVNWVQGDTVRPLDYEQDILFGLDWATVAVEVLGDRIPLDGSHAPGSLVTRVSIGEGEGKAAFKTEHAVRLDETTRFDPLYATRVIADIAPNPWIARKLVQQLVDRLRSRGADDESIGAMSGFVIEEMRKFLLAERDSRAEALFMREVAAERIQFRLRSDAHNWEMPFELETALPETAEQLPRPDGTPTEKSVFAPVYRADFNPNEAECACYLDEREALRWWHRNVARAGHYHLQGWKKNKMYPDFLFALTHDAGKHRLIVMETKGDQLAGNLDTEYKRKLLQVLSENYAVHHTAKAGELELVIEDGTTVACDLVLISEWKNKVPGYFA